MAIKLSHTNRIQTNKKKFVVGKLTSIKVVQSEFVNQTSAKTNEINQIDQIKINPILVGSKSDSEYLNNRC